MGDDCDLDQFRILQLEEIKAIHCIYPPVMVSKNGNIDFEYDVPLDLMSESRFRILNAKSNIKTRLKIFESSIDGFVRTELIKFAFVISTIPNNELEQRGKNAEYAVVEVVYPKRYPEVPPYLSIGLTNKITPNERSVLCDSVTYAVGLANGDVCIFDVSLRVADFFSRASSKTTPNNFDETIGKMSQLSTSIGNERLGNRHGDKTHGGRKNGDTHDRSTKGRSNATYTPSQNRSQRSSVSKSNDPKSMGSCESDLIRLSSMTSQASGRKGSFDVLRELNALDVFKLSTHAMIHSPLWYEGFKKDDVHMSRHLHHQLQNGKDQNSSELEHDNEYQHGNQRNCNDYNGNSNDNEQDHVDSYTIAHTSQGLYGEYNGYHSASPVPRPSTGANTTTTNTTAATTTSATANNVRHRATETNAEVVKHQNSTNNNHTVQRESDSRDQQQDNNDGLKIPEIVYPLSTKASRRLQQSITLLKEWKRDVHVPRFIKDFESHSRPSDCIFGTTFTCRHRLDKNIYFVRVITLPYFCIYKTMNATSEDAIRGIDINLKNRRYVANKLVSAVGKMSTLHHKSIVGYHQYWFEREWDQDAIQRILETSSLLHKGAKTTMNGKDACKCLLGGADLIALTRLPPAIPDYPKDVFLTELCARRNVYLQMEYVNGWTLDQEIREHELYRNEQRIWVFIRHLLDVLIYLHGQKIYHQALSAHNVFIFQDDYGPKLKVADFGVVGWLRQICHSDYSCGQTQCCCAEYADAANSYLYESHPSTFGLGQRPVIKARGVNLREWLKQQQSEDVEKVAYLAEQEDMFAFGMLMFLMCRPPMDPNTRVQELSEMLADEDFPYKYLLNTPAPLVNTIHRLTRSSELTPRPTALELLKETLVPPVMDAELFSQYIRRLHNTHSEESLGAVRFLFARGWKANVSKSLKQNLAPLQKAYVTSEISDQLEAFMRSRSYMTVPCVVLFPRKGDQEYIHQRGFMPVLDCENTSLHLVNSMRRSLLKSAERYPQHSHSLGLKQFCMGTLYNGVDSGSLNAIFALAVACQTEEASQVRKSVDDVYDIMEHVDDRIIVSEAEVISTAIDSFHAMQVPMVVVVLYPNQLSVAMLCVVFGIKPSVSRAIISKIATVESSANEMARWIRSAGGFSYSTDVYAEAYGLLTTSLPLSTMLYRIHLLVCTVLAIPEEFEEVCMSTLETMQANVPEPVELKVTVRGIRPNQTLAPYIERILHMLKLSQYLNELVTGARLNCRLDECSLFNFEGTDAQFPNFTCAASYTYSTETASGKFDECTGMDGNVEVVAAAGGCCTLNYTLVDEYVLKRLFFYCEYSLDKLAMVQEQKCGNYGLVQSLDLKTRPRVDVVITCQNHKLLPAAHALCTKILDAGFSCECRAIALEHSREFYERLKHSQDVLICTHLCCTSTSATTSTSNQVNSNSVEMDGNMGLGSDSLADGADRLKTKISYHVECLGNMVPEAKRFDCDYEAFGFIKSRLGSNLN